MTTCCAFIQVEETQQQLQTLELAIDANKERARKLELELKAMSNLQWQVSPPSHLLLLYKSLSLRGVLLRRHPVYCFVKRLKQKWTFQGVVSPEQHSSPLIDLLLQHSNCCFCNLLGSSLGVGADQHVFTAENSVSCFSSCIITTMHGITMLRSSIQAG